MNLARLTYYHKPAGQPVGEAKAVKKIGEICAEYPRYGYRRVTAQLHRDGLAVNHKRAMRIMREQGFTVRPRRRFVVTTNSNHFGPIFPNLAKELTLKGVPVGNLIRLASEAESRNVSIL
jgi:putative transposase